MSDALSATGPAPLPDDVAALQALLLAERARAERLSDQNERLRAILRELQRALFGRRSEKAVLDQLELALEDVEQAIAEAEAEEEKGDATLKASRRQARHINRGALPKHLPREEIVLEPMPGPVPAAAAPMHQIGEDTAERLDVVPTQLKVIVTRRPKYGCRACEGAVVQASAPARLIEGGLPTEAMVAHVLVSKYADHLPLLPPCVDGPRLARETLAGGRRSLAVMCPASVMRSTQTAGPDGSRARKSSSK